MSAELAKFTTSGTQIKGSIPFAKIDTEKRTVRGFATLDNVDLHGDVVTFDATEQAFAKTTARIREMHQPRVAGTIASFEKAEYYDPETNKTYRGMMIEARISKGNQDAWEMVLDGSYSAFSIGGNITDSETDFVKDENGGRDVRFIKGYELNEISLVDNGGNQFANFMSIEKAEDGGVFMKGMITDSDEELKKEHKNVFYCEGDKMARILKDDTAECLVCNSEMTSIGWMEDEDMSKVDSMINDFVKSQEGGNQMSDEVRETEENEPTVDEVTEAEKDVREPDSESRPENEESSEEETSEETEVDETEGVANDLEKAVEDLKSSIDNKLTENQDAFEKKVEEIKEQFAKADQELDQKLESLVKRVDEVTETHENIQKRLGELNDSLGKSATRSSEESEVEVETKLEKSRWGGHFL